MAAGLLARGVEEGGRDDLALGAVLAGYALGSAGFSLHHVLCQTVVRVCGTSHSVTNAAVLPHSLAAMAAREPEAIAELAAALGTEPDGLTARVSALAGGARLGLDEAELPAARRRRARALRARRPLPAARARRARGDPQAGALTREEANRLYRFWVVM